MIFQFGRYGFRVCLEVPILLREVSKSSSGRITDPLLGSNATQPANDSVSDAKTTNEFAVNTSNKFLQQTFLFGPYGFRVCLEVPLPVLLREVSKSCSGQITDPLLGSTASQ